MTDLTHIHSANAIGIAVVGLFSLAPAATTSVLWTSIRSRVGFLTWYALVMTAVCLFAATQLGVPRLLPSSPLMMAGALAGGTLVFAFAAVASVTSHGLARRIRRGAPRSPYDIAWSTNTGWDARRPVGSGSVARPGDNSAALALNARKHVVWLATIGLLEEVLYRGYAVTLAFMLPGVWLEASALMFAVAMFGIAHISFGWPNALTTLCLGAAAMAAVLVTGTLAPAIIGHVLYNVWTGRRN